VPKYTGLYSISLAIYCANTALGDTILQLVLQFLYSNYNVNGTKTYIISCDASLNKSVNILNGNMIVDAIADTPIRIAVATGSCQYVGILSYFHGYYIGSS
jgi:hypothetical protein